MADDQGISIVAYEDRFAEDFARLNREWLDRFGLYEEADGKQLYAPRQAIIDTGGEIFVAMKAGAWWAPARASGCPRRCSR